MFYFFWCLYIKKDKFQIHEYDEAEHVKFGAFLCLTYYVGLCHRNIEAL